MNQCANAGAASLERCKRAAQSPAALPPIHSLSLLLLWSPFSSATPLFSLLFPLQLLLISHIHHHCYVHIPLLSDAFILFSQSLTWSSLPCPAILFVHFILCSCHFLFPYCIALVGAIISTFHLPRSYSSFPVLSQTLYPLLFWKRVKGRKKKSRSHREMKTEKRKKYEERGTSKRGETKSSLLSLWWEKMSEGAIIKLEFFNTVKNGALTAHRQCKGQAPTTHGEPPN